MFFTSGLRNIRIRLDSPITVQHWHCDRKKTHQGEFNVDMRIGGDSGLSPRGEEFARRTAEFVALAGKYWLEISWYSILSSFYCWHHTLLKTFLYRKLTNQMSEPNLYMTP